MRRLLNIGVGLGLVAALTVAAVSTPGIIQITAGTGLTGGTIGPGSSGTIALSTPVGVTNGGTGLSGVSVHEVAVGTGSNTYTAKTIPDCQDSAGNHINYTQGTDSFSCGTSSSGGGSFPLRGANGTSAAPSYSFTNGTDSGMYADANGSVTVIGSAGTVGGSVTLTGGTPTSGSANGGAINLNSGTGNQGANAGNITLTAGAGAHLGLPGNINITAGSPGPDSSNFSGNIIISVPAANGFSTGGSTSLSAGNGGANGSGGAVTVQAGNGGASGGNGANVNLLAGTAAAGTAGSVAFNAGQGTGRPHLAGLINTALTSTGNGADTTEDTLQSYSLPVNSLDTVGRCIRVTSWGTTANNGDNKTIRVYFGASLIASTTAAFTNLSWIAHLTVCKTGSNTQSAIGDLTVGTTVIAPAHTAGADSDTAAITIKTTGQAGAANANDIVSKGQIVEFLS
jgi:hypothetical protein